MCPLNDGGMPHHHLSMPGASESLGSEPERFRCRGSQDPQAQWKTSECPRRLVSAPPKGDMCLLRPSKDEGMGAISFKV